MSTDTATDVTFVPVGAVSDLTRGEGRAYAVGGDQIAVFLLGDGTVRATAAVCPHRGGPIADGQSDDTKVMCPLHQYVYSFADGACNDPSIPTLAVYPARVVDGVIEVAVS
ncbi:Rieske (2Fe-2S) protein [Williamsia maris]|uniref:Nitrite reductase (NADH) small subunit n=1 Tax=Williamsia maris TaxID=72806 RepID=A0ABT1HJY6_9NOCA|nr:Rieske (2Fe-2S) protein [Williamsia maris]MCP2178262.1 nitrite reductase (NADH) small subunit [Williamsia maris]